jgi:guanylate kinase
MMDSRIHEGRGSRSADGKGRLVVISGPSGSGKSTIARRLAARREVNAMLSVSMTTRAPRAGEREGVDYYFRDRADFESARASGSLLESALVHGQYYGTPIEPVLRTLDEGMCVLLEIDVQGALRVKERVPNAVLVFIHPPSMEELERRLRDRKTEDEAAIARRLAAARDEIAKADRYDHQIVNVDLDQCVERLVQLLINLGCGGMSNHD